VALHRDLSDAQFAGELLQHRGAHQSALERGDDILFCGVLLSISLLAHRQLEENGISGTAMNMDAKFRAHSMAAGLLAGSGVLYTFSPTEHSFYPICLFHALTGWQCPGCGG